MGTPRDCAAPRKRLFHGVGTAAFATQVKFTIAAGQTDFAVGDYFTITVTAAVPSNGLGTFSVTDPDGHALPAATVDTAYVDQIGFTINNGTTNFVVGDTFTITVSATNGNFVLANKTAVDGSQAGKWVLAADMPASATAASASIVWAGQVDAGALNFADANVLADHVETLWAQGVVPVARQ